MSDPDARVPRFQAGARYDRYGITSLTGDSFCERLLRDGSDQRFCLQHGPQLFAGVSRRFL